MNTATTLHSPEPQTENSQPSGAENNETAKNDPRQWGWLETSPGKLAAGLLFGVAFGFLLQKGGVAKFDILLGVLLLENFVVVKIMLSAIIVGMIGTYFMRKTGRIERKINETKLGGNLIGGLIFGAGFALLAYCPGTNAAAVGQGNLDAITGVAGLLLGSYLFALSSKFGGSSVSEWGKYGKLTLNEVVGVREGVFIAIAIPLFIAILVGLEFAGF